MTDYLQWQSRLTLKQVFAQGENFSYPVPIGNGFLYLSNLKNQDNRSVLMIKQSSDVNESSRCITPVPFNLRTKINEYGGKPFWIFGNTIYFSNQSDQRLYQQNIDPEKGIVDSPMVVSPQANDQQSFMFADLVELQDQWLLAVVETSNDLEELENVHSIQALKNDSPDTEMVELASGASFYSNLVVSPTGNQVAWVQWDHPAMPWDETQLWVAEISQKAGDLSFINQQRIEFATKGLEGASVCQLIFANNGHLFFSADFQNAQTNTASNYWNIMCYKFDGSDAQSVTSLLIEFGYPHWQYGDARIVQFDGDHLLTFGTGTDGDQLYLIDQNTLIVRPYMDVGFTQKNLQNLSSDSIGTAMAVALSVDSSPSVVAFRFIDGHQFNQPEILQSNTRVLKQADVSIAEHFDFVTRDNSNSYGYYYAPVNTGYENDSVPPLIVMVHGGPTARTYGYFDIQKQFWTNRGFAIFDVNPRGSTGYGRAFRSALYGHWGVTDISDVIDGVIHLIEVGKADEQRICIRGKSSGGYAVLRALTEYPEVFQAGACYYGIGNLATLAEVTHKFEKYYTDRLIGEEYNSGLAQQKNSLFHQRSPIHKVTQLKTPMIIFQGLEDKIVPPSVAQEVISALEKTGLEYSYVEYPDEGHGFRQANNNIDALSQELAFYKKVLSV